MLLNKLTILTATSFIALGACTRQQQDDVAASSSMSPRSSFWPFFSDSDTNYDSISVLDLFEIERGGGGDNGGDTGGGTF